MTKIIVFAVSIYIFGSITGFIIGIEVETKYCVSYYGAKQ